jgi:hypothetical protein
MKNLWKIVININLSTKRSFTEAASTLFESSLTHQNAAKENPSALLRIPLRLYHTVWVELSGAEVRPLQVTDSIRPDPTRSNSTAPDSMRLDLSRLDWTRLDSTGHYSTQLNPIRLDWIRFGSAGPGSTLLNPIRLLCPRPNFTTKRSCKVSEFSFKFL